MKIYKQVLALALSFGIASSVLAEGPPMPPGVKGSHEVQAGEVLKVYSAQEGEHRFVAYVVKWKGAEVVVSDPLAKSDFKVGDTIKFVAQKLHLEKTTPELFVLSFGVLPLPPSAPEKAKTD